MKALTGKTVTLRAVNFFFERYGGNSDQGFLVLDVDVCYQQGQLPSFFTGVAK